MVGDWTVQVIGSNVPVGPQPFALVATGNLDASYGRVTLDRVVYAAGETVRLAVRDSLATSVLVLVASGIEPAGADVALGGGGGGKIWAGLMRAAVSPAFED